MPNTTMPATPETGDVLLVFGDGGRDADAFRDQLADHLVQLGAVHVREVDAWSAGSMAVEYGVRSLPTAVLLRGGDELARLVGPATRRRITRFATSLGAGGSPSDPRLVPTTSTAPMRTVAVGGRAAPRVPRPSDRPHQRSRSHVTRPPHRSSLGAAPAPRHLRR